jgi:tetratricopeptide (TPR) repeat protein
VESNEEELIRLGLREFDGSNFNAAIDYFTKVLALNPRNTSALNNRAICYRQLRDYENALEDATFAVSIAPDESLHHSTRATILTKLERQLDALDELDKAIALEPLAEYVINKVVILKKLNRYKDALSVIEGIESQGHSTAELSVYKGVILLEIKKYDQAVKVFRSLLNGSQHKLAMHYLKQVNSKLN